MYEPLVTIPGTRYVILDIKPPVTVITRWVHQEPTQVA
jgi:hypothetical protein